MNRCFILVIATAICFSACKNNGGGTATSVKNNTTEAKVVDSPLKEIIVGAKRQITERPDFSVMKWSVKEDVLTAVVRYSGGCGPHNFNAYFSGGWAKSLPPQAVLDLEHINLENDLCRSLVTDTLYFNLAPLQYSASTEVIVKWSGDNKTSDNYRYGKK
ncbi:MAG: hypothetical protein ACPGU4_10530 [Flavobacteriales bacterium]